MKKHFYFILISVSLGFFVVAFSTFSHRVKRINCTELNGAGCVCHGVIANDSVKTWVTGPAQLEANQTGIYRVYLAGGPALGGGHNVAVRYGMMSTVDSFSVLVDNELTQAMPLVFPSRLDTLHWDFAYTAPDTACIDTLYSCGLSTNHDGAPDIGDEWSYGPKFPITVIPKVVPVELISFTVDLRDDGLILRWVTATETNNKEFVIEGSNFTNGNWEFIRRLAGNGTKSSPTHYSFMLPSTSRIQPFFRLKQIDLDGTVRILKSVGVNGNNRGLVNGISVYPNPVKDKLSIRFSSGISVPGAIKIYNLTGALLFEEKIQAETGINFFEKSIRSMDLPSAVMLVELNAGNERYFSKIVITK